MYEFISLYFAFKSVVQASQNQNCAIIAVQMQSYFFGPMDEYIEASYAPTNRASCRGCKCKIQKDTVRLGQIFENDHFNGRLYFHLECFTLKPLFKDIDPEQQIYKLDELEKEDRKQVIIKVKTEVKKLKEEVGGKKISVKKRFAMKKKEEQVEKEKEETNEQADKEVNKRRVTRSQSRPKSEKKKASPSPSPKQTKSKPQKKITVSTQGSAKKKKVKKQKKQVESGYTPAQQKEFKQLVQKYMEMTIGELKEILTANNQTKTSTKPELAQKCADGQLLGRIPMCPSCGGGRLRWRWQNGLYTCPGYMDDDEFRNCNKIFTMKEIVREPWIHK